jgi:hypothetical protein
MAEPIDVPFATTTISASAPAPAPIAYASGALDAYHSAAPHARLMIRALWVAVAADLVMLWPTVATFLQRLSATSNSRVFEPVLVRVGIWSQVVLSLATLLALVWWAMWIHRVYRNLTPLGATALSHSPAWAVAYNFIPILHLFRPFQVTREAWRASDARHHGGDSWRQIPAPALVNAWWATSLLADAAFVATWLIDSEDADRTTQLAWTSSGIALVLLRAAAFVLQIAVVRRLTAMQDERAGRVETTPTTAQ